MPFFGDMLVSWRVARERWWLEDYFPFGKVSFQELCSTSGGYDNHRSWIRVKQRIKDFRSTQRMVYLPTCTIQVHLNVESLGLENFSHPIFKSSYGFLTKKSRLKFLCFRFFCLLETFGRPRTEHPKRGGGSRFLLVGPTGGAAPRLVWHLFGSSYRRGRLEVLRKSPSNTPWCRSTGNGGESWGCGKHPAGGVGWGVECVKYLDVRLEVRING